MLKLERQSQWGPIHVSVRHRDRMLTPAFLFALCLAAGLHLIGIVLFQIKPYFVRDAARIFPPVEVTIDFSKGSEGTVEAQLIGNRRKVTTFDLPFTPPILPTVPNIAMKSTF